MRIITISREFGSGGRVIAEKLSEIAVATADSHNTEYIGVTGGVFYNNHISEVVKEYVETEGFEFVQHEQTCAGDGSVSMGQCAIAGWRDSYKKNFS